MGIGGAQPRRIVPPTDRMTPAMARKLRIAVVCGPQIEAWQARAIELIDAGDGGEVVAMLTASPSTDRSKGRLWRWFARTFRPRTTRLQFVGTRFTRLRCDDLEAVRAADLDAILVLGEHDVDDAIAAEPRYGVWTFQYGNERGDRGGPPCFWEIYFSEPVIGATLERSVGTAKSRTVLREGYLKVVEYHYPRSVDQLNDEIARWPARAVAEIAAGANASAKAETCEPRRRAYRLPSDADVLRFLSICGRNVLRRLWERGIEEEWNIGAVRLRREDVLRGAAIRDVAWRPMTSQNWAADPMALKSNGRLHVLCEEMNLRTGKGQISETSFDGSGWTAFARAIATPTHASYPFLFEEAGSVFCVPETFEANEIALYRASAFPTSWERVATILDGVAAIDSTLFRHEDRFWLLCTTSEGSNSLLHAFFADRLLGPWYPHAANPVKIDVRNARPAGAPFSIGGQLYRPAQDSSKTYGGRVVVNRVLSLTPTSFREEPCVFVEPQRETRYGHGLHTLSFAGEYCVIDGKRFVRRWPLAKLFT